MAPGKLVQWARLIAPALIDRLIVKVFFIPAVRRVQTERR
jgi:hypothetical protein